MPSPDPLQPYRKVQAKSDADLARILQATAKAIAARILGLNRGVGGDIRGAQLRLTLAAIKKMQKSMWANGVTPLVESGMDSATEAAEGAIGTMSRVAYAALPEAVAEELIRGLRLSAESGLKSDATRRKRELSERVYKLSALHTGKVEDMIRQGLIANLTSKELAGSVRQYISPDVKGGASYAAMRLARTEINNAFHERQINGAKRPGVSAAVWNLSGSHVVPDECNIYAAHNGNGEYPPDQIPEKPHPHCFCYLTYKTTPPDDFQAQLLNGDFDDELDRRTKANLKRLGVGSTPPTS